VDIALRIDATSPEADRTEAGSAERSPLVVASRFRLDSLLQRAALPVDSTATGRRAAVVVP
jgi:hypothetical protein